MHSSVLMCVDDFFLQVMLPTGTKVTVKDSYQAFINIFIYPSAADYNKTEGTVLREKNIRAIAQLIIGTYIYVQHWIAVFMIVLLPKV